MSANSFHRKQFRLIPHFLLCANFQLEQNAKLFNNKTLHKKLQVSLFPKIFKPLFPTLGTGELNLNFW